MKQFPTGVPVELRINQRGLQIWLEVTVTKDWKHRFRGLSALASSTVHVEIFVIFVCALTQSCCRWSVKCRFSYFLWFDRAPLWMAFTTACLSNSILTRICLKGDKLLNLKETFLFRCHLHMAVLLCETIKIKPKPNNLLLSTEKSRCILSIII